MKRILKVLLMAGALAGTFAALAETTTFNGVTVDYGTASTNWVDGELILQYKTVGADSLAISGGAVKADILVVGGGGGGGGGYSGSYGGSGGGGGAVKESELSAFCGKLEISVGGGGAGGASGAIGKTGDDSSVTGDGFEAVVAAGGAAGAAGKKASPSAGKGASGSGTTGVTSETTGETKTYGVGGAAGDANAPGSPVANTGNGGKGGMKNSTASKRVGGAGGSGVVVVRLTAAYRAVDVALKELTLGVGEEVVAFAEASTGSAVDIIYSEIMSAGFDPEGVVRGERMKDGHFAFIGSNPGTTTATILVLNEEEMTRTTYTAILTVTPSVSLKDLSLQRGETTASLVPEGADTPIDLDYDAVKALKSSVPEIADFVKLPNGKIGVVGKLTGTVDMTIIVEGQSYACKVTVETLLSGLYRAGAYDVAVTNASDVFYADGDLVLVYRNVDSTVAKSFELPKPTTGRLLAVGGGGAGGQEPGVRNDSYGLPGGGGAGGLVVVDDQAFAAAAYAVTVGAGGVAARKKPSSATAGASGAATTVKGDGTTLANALGGGGGGARSVGGAGGSGGGGSYSGSAKNGGAKQQASPGLGFAGGRGGFELFGAGGGGAGGAGGDTGSYSAFYNKSRKTFTDPTTADVYQSGAGGIGKTCDITGENVEYARGGAGGVSRLYAYYYKKGGKTYYTNSKPSDSAKRDFDGGKYFWCEASDGKPGRDGYGDGGGGGSYYSTAYGPTFAGRGGNGAVIVRIPPYETTVEDALKAAFAGQPVTVSGSTVTLTDAITGPIAIPDNLGGITIKLDGHAIMGAAGAAGDDITAGGDGQPALKIVPHEYDCESGVTALSVTGPGTMKGGDGGKGYPGGAGAAFAAADGFTVYVADGIAVLAGTAGESLVQHPHKWDFQVEDGKIVATCIAEGDCSYKSRGPLIAIDAADADFTGRRYEGLTLVNTITAVTGLSVPPPTFEGIDGTDYPETSTAPVEQGKYRAKLVFGNMTISDTFTIVEAKSEQDMVYKSWKTATRDGDSVDIRLTATFSANHAINYGNVLFLGSRCNAHSMATGTVEKAVNAMTKYANVRWYAFGETDPDNNHNGELVLKGETLSFTENSGKVTDETVHLEGGNHFVHKEMMNALYDELIEKKNLKGDYDLILLEFDGDLLCREGVEPYQLNYDLPEGWDDEKAAQLRAVMETYYKAGRVVWLVPDVNQPKSDAGYTGEYPWTSNPEFIWQRAFLRATETEGYKNPYQKNYEDANALVSYIEDALIGGYFQTLTISDTVKEGLKIESVTPQIRTEDGLWMDMQKVSANGDAGGTFSITDPLFGVEITATVTVTDEQKVETVFDTSNVQLEAKNRDLVIGNDLQVKINATIGKSFFEGVPPDEWKETNEDHAIFTFNSSLLDEEFAITTSNAPPKIQNAVQLRVFVKPPLVSSGRLRELIGVPWKGADGNAVLLDAYVDKEDLTVGDLLFVYNRSTKGYDGYVLDGEKMWQAAETLRVKDGEVTGTLAADPKAVRVPVGLAAWIERQDASKPITFRGVPADGVNFALDTGYNLVSGPGPEPFGLEGIPACAEGDRVILPRYGEEPQVFVREATGWTFKTNAVKYLGGEAVAVPTKVTEPKLMTVPAGFGFWYEKK